jgi:hypothetical protein
LLAAALVAALAVAALACAGRDWNAARAENTASAYHQFLREHPNSSHAREARERIALVRARSKPTPEAYRAFLEEFPDSPRLDELRTILEEALFLRTRAVGTAEAYREFLSEFSGSAYAARAAGNAEYLEERGFEGRPSELADFAARHPESDFSAEAVRSSAAVRVRDESGFRRVGLVVEIADGAPDADRLARTFTERAVSAYREAELEAIPLEAAGESGGESLPVRLTIRHREQWVATELRGGEMVSSAMLATTEITLAAVGESEPIWSREIEYRDSGAVHREGKSILFGPAAYRYWSAFFVPRATWNTQVAVREAQLLSRPIVSVETTRDRALVLFGDGEFRILDLADPAQPLSLGTYRRERDLTHWSGIRLLEPGAVLFGEDGIEVVELGPGGPRRVRALDRSTVGSVVGVESAGGQLLSAGNRGLLLLDGSDEPETLFPREVLGLASFAGGIVFTDGQSLLVSTIPLLREGRTLAELHLGRGFAPGRVRVQGRAVVVLGEKRGVARLDLAQPARPVLRSRIDVGEAGEIQDATLSGGRLFLLGDRGLQVTDASGERVVDSADVVARSRIAVAGRHLVMIGERALQVVDATPFVASEPVASPHR